MENCNDFALEPRHLVLLVLGHQVVHVALGLRELHLVHALAPEGKRLLVAYKLGYKLGIPGFLFFCPRCTSPPARDVYQWRKALRRNMPVNLERAFYVHLDEES